MVQVILMTISALLLASFVLINLPFVRRIIKNPSRKELLIRDLTEKRKEVISRIVYIEDEILHAKDDQSTDGIKFDITILAQKRKFLLRELLKIDTHLKKTLESK